MLASTGVGGGAGLKTGRGLGLPGAEGPVRLGAVFGAQEPSGGPNEDTEGSGSGVSRLISECEGTVGGIVVRAGLERGGSCSAGSGGCAAKDGVGVAS